MENSNKKNSMYTLDMIYVFVFGIVSAVSFFGVLSGAWWHIFTVVVCAALSKASWNDAMKEKRMQNQVPNENYGNKSDRKLDHEPYPDEFAEVEGGAA